MSKKFRILVLTSTFPRWQGDNEPPFVFELCRRLGAQFDITVLAPHAEGAKSFEKMEGLDVIRFRYCAPRWERLTYCGGILANLKRSRWCYLLLPLYFVAQLAALRRILRDQRIDAIHAHWLIPQGLTVAIASMFGKNIPPMICTSHGGDLLGLNGRLLNSLKRWVIRRSTVLTVVSHAMAEHALSLGAKPDRLQTVSMGVDTNSAFTPDNGIPRATNEILFVGRLVDKKGCKYLLEAMPEVLKKHSDTRLVVVGSGPEEESLKKLADRLGVAHAVAFRGAVSNFEIPDCYRRATIFVAPFIVTDQGDQEGLGLVLVEALGCECCVVASDIPAIHDVIIDGQTGMVCRQKDSLDIANRIITLLERPDLRLSLARAGRQYVQDRFAWDTISSRYASLVDRVIRDRA